MRNHNHSTRSPHMRSFTLLEMIIVLIILGVLLTLTVPRLGGQAHRKFMLGVDQVTDFLSMFAYREQLGQQALAIDYNGESNTFSLLVRDTENSDPMSPAIWEYDRLVTPVTLPVDVSISDLRLDGSPIDSHLFQIVTKPNEDRPLIEMTLQSGDYDYMTLVLMPHSITPYVYGIDAIGRAPRQAVDLDSTGRNRDDW